jgi:hypothetical protein
VPSVVRTPKCLLNLVVIDRFIAAIAIIRSEHRDKIGLMVRADADYVSGLCLPIGFL